MAAMECCSTDAAAGSQKPLYDCFVKQESYAGRQKRILFENSSYTPRAFEVLNSFRNDEVLCDIKLETDDGTIIFGHKVILAAATDYFRSMFTNYKESKEEHVILRELDSTALKLLVDYIYTAKITITEYTVEELLNAANLLQLPDVKDVCCEFMLSQLNPTNCFKLKTLASMFGCTEFLAHIDSFIQLNFSEVVRDDSFLCLPYEEVIELISCDKLNVLSEENVFECVISWMNHNAKDKEEILLKLMEHVRLPFTSKEYLLKRVKREPLIINSLKCKDFIMEALEFHLLKDQKSDLIPATIRTRPRQPAGSPRQIIVVVGYGNNDGQRCFILEWYNPDTNKWQVIREINSIHSQFVEPNTVILNNQLLFLFNYSPSKSIDVYICDLFSPYSCFTKNAAMLRNRNNYGLCVSNNCIYAIGGKLISAHDRQFTTLKDGEVFSLNTQKWQMIAEMNTPRYAFGVGAVNNFLYAVGGNNGTCRVRTVERYYPPKNLWHTVSEMVEPRTHVGVGVLNGILYAVGGQGNKTTLSSVEAYDTTLNTWTFVASMNKCRYNPKIVTLDGLMYAVGGHQDTSVEVYNPRIDTWTMLSEKMQSINTFTGVDVIKKPSTLNNV